MAAVANQKAARRERRRRGLVQLGAAAAVALCWFLVARLIFTWQAARCPATTFYADSPAPQHVFALVPLVIAAVCSGLVVASRISGKAWPRLGMPAPGVSAPRPSRSSRRLRRNSIILTGLAATALPVSIGFSFCQFCLTPEGIDYRAAPWSGFRSYAWSDVAGIKTACWSGRRGWNAEYVLGLGDGSSIDIMGSAKAAQSALPQVMRALHGRDLEFDASRVSRYCGFPNAKLLRERP